MFDRCKYSYDNMQNIMVLISQRQSYRDAWRRGFLFSHKGFEYIILWLFKFDNLHLICCGRHTHKNVLKILQLNCLDVNELNHEMYI